MSALFHAWCRRSWAHENARTAAGMPLGGRGTPTLPRCKRHDGRKPSLHAQGVTAASAFRTVFSSTPNAEPIALRLMPNLRIRSASIRIL